MKWGEAHRRALLYAATLVDSADEAFAHASNSDEDRGELQAALRRIARDLYDRAAAYTVREP